MLREAFESVAPYISNLSKIKEFVDENESRTQDEIIKLLEDKIQEESGTLATDYRILLNEIRKIINTEM